MFRLRIASVLFILVFSSPAVILAQSFSGLRAVVLACFSLREYVVDVASKFD